MNSKWSPHSIAQTHTHHSPTSDALDVDYNWTFTLISFINNIALKRISSEDLPDMEDCSSRLCQMRSVLAIMVGSSGGASLFTAEHPAASFRLWAHRHGLLYDHRLSLRYHCITEKSVRTFKRRFTYLYVKHNKTAKATMCYILLLLLLL